MPKLTLLSDAGALSAVELNESPGYAKPVGPLGSRVAYAAAHVVPQTWADNTPGRPAEVDWDATLDFRRAVYSWGLGVADAMDTAQRNMGLDAALADPRWEIYADFLVTKARASALRKDIAAGKTIYTEKPTAETVDEALELAKLAQEAGVKTGVVHDKLYLPGLQKLKRLIDSGFFGRILSVRGEFGYLSLIHI